MKIAGKVPRLAAALILVWPVFAYAAPKACSCKHLEAIQQELKNAIYLEKFQADMAKEVEKAEKAQQDLRDNNPTHPMARFPVMRESKIEWQKQKAKVEFPVPHVTGYTGPASVALITGRCTNRAADLKAIADGASCKDIGAIVLKHEEEHRKLCENMGQGPYWERLYSEFAKEEAERYKAQAKALRELLKKVIDASTVKISEETVLKIEAGPMQTTYRIAMPAVKLTGKSSPAKDDWELKGEGTRTVGVTSVKLPGMSCTPPPEKLSSKINGTLKLDGFTMSFEEKSQTIGGSLSMKCKVPGAGQGFGFGVAPPGEAGSGEVFKDKDVQLKTTLTENVERTPWSAAMSQAGVTATGTQTTKVEITCR